MKKSIYQLHEGKAERLPLMAWKNQTNYSELNRIEEELAFPGTYLRP